MQIPDQNEQFEYLAYDKKENSPALPIRKCFIYNDHVYLNFCLQAPNWAYMYGLSTNPEAT